MSLKAIAKKKAFTLVELLIVVIIIAILAAIAIPKFTNASLRSKESSLKAELKLLRDGIELYKNDCGGYPITLADMAATSSPATCYSPTQGATITIPANSWRGPYVSKIDSDPVSANSFTYTDTTGAVVSSASGNDSQGIAYSTY